MRDDAQDLADVARVVAGDTGAFEGIVRRWRQPLISIAWRFCRDRGAAEDMAQDVFLKVFRALPSFRGESAFSTWMMSVAVNTFRSGLRSRLPPLDDEQAVAHGPGALQGLQQREREEAVRRAVLTLPAHYRDAILVFYFEEKDLAETARVLDVSEGTLKARLHRGRELLKRRCSTLPEFIANAAREKS